MKGELLSRLPPQGDKRKHSQPRSRGTRLKLKRSIDALACFNYCACLLCPTLHPPCQGLAYKEFWRLAKESCSKKELDLLTMTSDRSIFPRRTDYNQLYTHYHQTKYGSKSMDSMFNTLDGKYIYSCI